MAAQAGTIMTKKQKKTLYRILVTAALLVLWHFVPLQNPWRLFLYLIPYGIIGWDVLRKAVLGIKNGQVFDENFLMAVATVGAMVLGFFTDGEEGGYLEGVAVMLFYQIGELFQSVAVGKSRKSITDLMDIRPDYANLVGEDGETETVDPDDVEIGSLILIKPGEKIPIDGIVVSGSGSVNTVALTGESVPRSVHEGDEVISGCISENGLLKIRTTKEFGESTASKILDLVENSSLKKSRSEDFISKFARYYTPAVCFSALALAVLPPVILALSGREVSVWTWVIRALTFLVISCPCALVISIPLSFFGGIGAASSRGILVKGSNYLETLSKVRVCVFDKTGTLTEGVFAVTEVTPADGFAGSADAGTGGKPMSPETALLYYAAHAELYSTHPIAGSIREAYTQRAEAPDPSLVTDVTEISGHGVTAGVGGRNVAAGNRKLMKRLGLEVPEYDGAGTAVYLAVDGSYAGRIVISDRVKEGAAQAIRGLKAAGIRQTVMLTGDRAQAAEHVAKDLGVDSWYAELLPADKVTKVEELLTKTGDRVAFVGDGINDAPVLSRADVGIAMGGLGSDAAIEAADVVLMDDDPRKIALAMYISRKCLRIVFENIVFAIGVKFLCLILGALGIANMWVAVFADVGVMVIAVLNAIRCLKVPSGTQ